MSTREALEILCKWRSVFAGWQLGTRLVGDPECDAVRDHREATIILRVEITALAGLLIDKGIITVAEFQEAVGTEALLLAEDYSRRFPGMVATPAGIEYDARAVETMKGWKP